MTSTCRCCCPACSRHFASLEAFDAHRTGDHRSSDRVTGRHCADPLDVQDQAGEPRFAAADDDGECRMLAEPVGPAAIWALRRSAAEDARLRTLRGSPRMAREASGATPHGTLEPFPGWPEAA